MRAFSRQAMFSGRRRWSTCKWEGADWRLGVSWIWGEESDVGQVVSGVRAQVVNLYGVVCCCRPRQLAVLSVRRRGPQPLPLHIILAPLLGQRMHMCTSCPSFAS